MVLIKGLWREFAGKYYLFLILKLEVYGRYAAINCFAVPNLEAENA